MRILHCDSCGEVVFFHNDRCLSCGRELGFLPAQLEMMALGKIPSLAHSEYQSIQTGQCYRPCQNRERYQVCNWMVPTQDRNSLYVACRLTEVIPDRSDVKN